MKARFWVLVVVLIAGLLAIGLYMGWKRARVDQRIEEFFLRRMAALWGARVRVSDLHLGPGYVQLRGVILEDEKRGLTLTVDRARLRFSLLGLVTSGFRSSAVFKWMLLSHPRLVVDVDRFRAAQSEDSPGSFSLRGDLPEQITVSNGTVVFVRAGDDRRSECTEIDGLLEIVGGQEGSFRWTGCWGGQGVKNLLVSGSFSHLFEAFSLRANLQEASLVQVLAPAFPARYSCDGGLLTFSLSMDKSWQIRDPEILGKLEMEANGLVDGVLGIRLEKLRARARLEGTDLLVEGIEATARGAEVKAYGRISHLLRPNFHLLVEAKGVDAEQVMAKAIKGSPEWLPRGLINLKGLVEGSEKNLTFRGQLNAPKLEVSGHQLASLKAHLEVKGPLVQVRGLEAQLPWAVLRFQGQLDMAQSPVTLEAEWGLDQVDLAEASKHLDLVAIHGEGALAGGLTGPVGALHLTGGLQLSKLESQWLPVEELRGQFHWGKGQLNYRLESPDGRVLLRGEGTGWSRSSAHQAVLQVQNLPVSELLRGKEAWKKGGRLSGQWNLSGSAAQANLLGKVELERITGVKGRFDSWGEFSLGEQGQWRLDAEAVSRNLEIQGVPLSLKLRFSLDDRQLQMSELNINDQLKMFGVMERGGHRRLDGQLIFSQVDAQELCKLLSPALAGAQVEGFISGQVELSGTMSTPEARGEVKWIQGRLARLDDLSLRLPLWLSNGTLHLEPAVLSHGGRRLMALNGEVNFGRSLSLQAWGEEVEAQVLAQLFDQIPSQVEGVLNFQCRIGGSTRSPVFDGQMQWVQGQLRMMNFDDLSIYLRGEEGRLELGQFSMIKRGQRQVSATGSVPYSLLGLSRNHESEEELDLSFKVEGDVLSLLPSFTSYVRKASGYGEVSFRLGGSPGSLILGSGRLNLRGGWMEPAHFVQKLENLNAWVEIDEEGRFVQIKELNGAVAGSSVEVVNFQELQLGHRRLKPIRIPGLGLSLGILGIRTEENGVEVNIPGLMAGGETGKIRLCGTDLRDPLIAAGPLESPEILGMLGLNHLDFTYPPYSSHEGPRLDILRQVHWGLTAMALKDVWYENDFADLRVKDTQSKLRFTGSEEDGTLRVMGHLEADRGEVTYLDRQFQVVKLDLEFEGHEKPSLRGYDNRPLVSGQFETTVYSESTGVATDIYITLYALDPETGERTLQGRWGDFKLELSSSDPSDDTQEKILAKLGYSGDYADKALQLLEVTLGPKLESRFIRPVLEPVERTIKRALGIDVVRFQSGLARNLLVQDERPPGAYESLSRRLLFPRSSLLVGKYLTDNCFLSYHGQFRTRTDEFLDDRLGLVHRFGLEYRLRGSTILDLEYDYERDLTEGDKKVKTSSDKKLQVTHRFLF